ncbi:MAG: cytochrome P450 [Candidatus Rokuibacteriota bacterium]|nr:MAG: cytochrome P450 [Candidatus Rokubacteria bacterium]
MTAAGVLSEEAERAAALALDLRALPDDFYDDPFPYYHRLRRWDPVHRGPDGSYFLTRYDDVVAVYQDHHTWSSDKRVEFAPKFGASPLYEHHTTSVVFRDPPDHTRIRKLFAPAFTPRALAALEPRVARFVDGLLDRAAARGGMDVVEDFAAALPVQLIGDMLGVPREERGPLRGWSLAILGALEPEPGPRRLEAGSRAVDEFKGYLRRLIADRRRRPSTDPGEILSALLAAEDAGDRLTELELLHQCIFLLNAGHETTTNLIANAVVSLLEHPREHLRLRAEPGLITTAVEEFLRFQSPNQLGNRRAVREAVLGGVAMDAGTLVTLGIGAANRDPAQFPDPDRLDIGRTPNRHLAFITGIHACAGMWLARMEGRAAIGRLVARFPNLRAAGPPVRAHRARFRVVSSFPITVG